ncbi:MAG: zf-HC2 domain-containing protein [Candidatus Latescibacterota bacterium]|nr:MAG: zf-HC2 domain-containing protein [Candidatus Latescibacterota bacterium]
MKCREFEELIVDALYGVLEQDAQKRLNAHIDSCRACAQVYAEMRSTLLVMEKRERPDPGEAFWDGYWNRLSSRMEKEETERRRQGWLGGLFPQLPATGLRWAYRGVLAVVLIVFGAVVGRMLLPGPGSEMTSGTDIAETPTISTTETPTVITDDGDADGLAVRPASAEACARQYIEDTQVLLLALVNFDPETEAEYLADWSFEKNRSRELIAQAASLKGDLKDPKQRRLRALVTELEAILLQIANLETTGDLESVELIRSSVDDRDVMLKINLEKLRAGDAGKPGPGACDVW